MDLLCVDWLGLVGCKGSFVSDWLVGYAEESLFCLIEGYGSFGVFVVVVN